MESLLKRYKRAKVYNILSIAFLPISYVIVIAMIIVGVLVYIDRLTLFMVIAFGIYVIASINFIFSYNPRSHIAEKLAAYFIDKYKENAINELQKHISNDKYMQDIINLRLDEYFKWGTHTYK